ncbi:MAG: carbohydrate-binding family 9-like protein [Kiritimatiellia bacterium]
MQYSHMIIPRLPESPSTLAEAADLLSCGPRHMVDAPHASTASQPQPEVQFAAGHSEAVLYLWYLVREPTVRAVHTLPQSPVCQDSCVEMFFAPHENVYLNLEWNAIGTLLAGRGPARAGREPLSMEQLGQIRQQASLGSLPFEERPQPEPWTLTAAVPFEILELDPEQISGRTFRANFYKCGDRLATPHYLSWNPVPTPNPDFHRPEHFGSVAFA